MLPGTRGILANFRVCFTSALTTLIFIASAADTLSSAATVEVLAAYFLCSAALAAFLLCRAALYAAFLSLDAALLVILALNAACASCRISARVFAGVLALLAWYSFL